MRSGQQGYIGYTSKKDAKQMTSLLEKVRGKKLTKEREWIERVFK